jgi:hypothetical protein
MTRAGGSPAGAAEGAPAAARGDPLAVVALPPGGAGGGLAELLAGGRGRARIPS